ncbi:MAG: OBG GTPase family GTP-binding protein [Candidatus Hadarchaeota archaeon]
MASIDEEIKEIEAEIRETPYNKATEEHIGRLKAKLAKLKEEKIKKSEKQSGGSGYAIEKSGDATVILAGFPSVGKSTLLNALTGADSEVADYEFTTLEVIPGTLKYKGADIQILDVPGIVSGASSGRGRGSEVISVFRSADLLVLMVDATRPERYHRIEKELYEAGIRLNMDPPNVKIERRDSGGLEISSTVDLNLSEDEIKSILRENGIVNAHILIRENIDNDRLIDAIMRNREYLPSFVFVNKIDLLKGDQLSGVKSYFDENFDGDVLYGSAEECELDDLREVIFEKLGLIRTFLKPKSGEPDMEDPLILERGDTIEDLCKELHREFLRTFRYAKVWGDSADHPGQKVGIEHELSDGDIVSVFK